MNRYVVSVLIMSAGLAQANSVPLRSLLESGKGNAGSIRLSNSAFVVSKLTGAGRFLTLGVVQAGSSAGRVSGVGVYAVTEYLTPSERTVFIQAVLNVALKCFNLRAERRAAITAWIDQQNASALWDVKTDFGPMNLRFVRDLDNAGQYTTAIYLRRSGQPGTTPWINYCTP